MNLYARRAGLRAASLIALVLAAAPARGGIEVYLAPIVFLDESEKPSSAPRSVERSLFEILSAYSFEEEIAVKPVALAAAPRSLLEALKLADSKGCPYLIYGYLRRTDYALSLELKLIDRDARAIGAVFFAGDSADRYERLVSDMGTKIAAYLEETFGFEPGGRGESAASDSVWSVPFSVGWWGPCLGSWPDALQGLLRARAGVIFRPRMPAYVKSSKPRQIGAGSDLEYALGMSAPGTEEAMLHSITWRVFADFEADLDEGRRVGVDAGPFLRVDILTQSRKYAAPFVDLAASLGAGGEVRYAWKLSDRISIGLTAGLDLIFYENPLVALSTSVRAEYRFLPKMEAKR